MRPLDCFGQPALTPQGTPEAEGTALKHLSLQKRRAARRPAPGTPPTGPAGSPELGAAQPLPPVLGALRPQHPHVP